MGIGSARTPAKKLFTTLRAELCVDLLHGWLPLNTQRHRLSLRPAFGA